MHLLLYNTPPFDGWIMDHGRLAYAREQAPPTALPPLGLSGAEEGEGRANRAKAGAAAPAAASAGGHAGRENAEAGRRLVSAWQREAAGGGGTPPLLLRPGRTAPTTARARAS